MNEDRRDALSVDDILNEYHAADAAYARRAAPPEPAAAPVRAARPQPAMAQAPQAMHSFSLCSGLPRNPAGMASGSKG